MQVINLEATISTPSLQVEMRTLRLGSGGGTTDYNDLSNKPKLEGVTLQGNVPISALGLRTSDLINDSGFITTGDIPTKTSDLTNDSNFQDATQVANAISAAIPTNVSSFTNDVGYITAAAIPTNVSAFTNDAGYLTSGDLPAFAVDSVNGQTGTVVLTGADIECGGSYHTNDAISTQIDAFTTDIASINANMPTKTSDLQNDSGYITATGAPVQTVNGQTGDVTITVPTDTNDLTNGAGYITAAGAPVQSVNGQTGTVSITPSDLAGPRAGFDDISNAGSDVLLTTAAEDTAVVYMTVNMSPIQAPGTPSPSNPLPITALTDVVIDITDSDSNVHNYTIPLGQTVFGGTLNVTTGELTINIAGVKISDLTWYYTSGLLCFNSPSLASTVAGGNEDVLCEVEEFLNVPLTSANINANDNFVRFNKDANGSAETGNFSAGALVLKDTDYSDVPSMIAAIGNNYITYKLATPITATLTPTEVRTYATQCRIQLTDCEIASLRFFTEGSEFLAPQVKTILQAFNLL